MIRYLLYWPIWLVATIVNLFAAPIVVLFADDQGWLPRWLWWFQTPDNSLDGDTGWRIYHRPFLNELVKKDAALNESKLRIWVNRIFWLYRNSMYGLKWGPLAVKFAPGYALDTYGNPGTSDQLGISGEFRKELWRDGKSIAWQFYLIRQWGDSDRCLRVNLGWKLWDFGHREQAAYVFSINPSKSFGELIESTN